MCRGSTPVTEIYLGLTNHPGQLSLAIREWVGGMSTGDDLLATNRKETASANICSMIVHDFDAIHYDDDT